MKNILSSLNESEKKRILEMHYKASNRHYLNEGYEKMAQALEKYSKSDYFDLGELAAKGASSAKDPVLHITLKNSASQNFVKVGTKNNEIYYCKTGWGGPNPFENNIKLEYLPNNYALYKTDAGKTPASIAQSFVVNVCNEIGFPQNTNQPVDATQQKSSATQSSAKQYLESSDNFQSVPYMAYFDYEYNTEMSTPGDVYVTVKRSTSYGDKFYTNPGKLKEGTFSCKNKDWLNSEPVKVGKYLGSDNPFEEVELVPSPAANGYPQVQVDKGKTPASLANQIVTQACKTATYK
jgi:hypothetical protein